MDLKLWLEAGHYLIFPVILVVARRTREYLRREFRATVQKDIKEILADKDFIKALADLVVKQVNGTYVSQKSQDTFSQKVSENFDKLESRLSDMAEELSRQANLQDKQGELQAAMHRENRKALEEIRQPPRRRKS